MKAHYRILFRAWDEEGNSLVKAFYLSAINPEDEFYKVWSGGDVRIISIKKV
jgi:hypothetical protein